MHRQQHKGATPAFHEQGGCVRWCIKNCLSLDLHVSTTPKCYQSPKSSTINTSWEHWCVRHVNAECTCAPRTGAAAFKPGRLMSPAFHACGGASYFHAHSCHSSQNRLEAVSSPLTHPFMGANTCRHTGTPECSTTIVPSFQSQDPYAGRNTLRLVSRVTIHPSLR